MYNFTNTIVKRICIWYNRSRKSRNRREGEICYHGWISRNKTEWRDCYKKAVHGTLFWVFIKVPFHRRAARFLGVCVRRQRRCDRSCRWQGDFSGAGQHNFSQAKRMAQHIRQRSHRAECCHSYVWVQFGGYAVFRRKNFECRSGAEKKEKEKFLKELKK